MFPSAAKYRDAGIIDINPGLWIISKDTMRKYIITLILLATIYCTSEKYPDKSISNSLLPETDIVLIPEKYNILDDDWIFGKTRATYRNRYLADHGYDHGESATEQIDIGHTTHFTGYDYDRKIPLFFYGRWFNKGPKEEAVSLQHIVPTIAGLVGEKGGSFPEYSLVENTGSKPEIVVTVVIDQGGGDLLRRMVHLVPETAKIRQASADYINAGLAHLEAHTASGHASIGTGHYPASHGIAANSIYYPRQGKMSARNVYTGKGIDLSWLKVSTLADIYDKNNGNKPVIISQSYAARASIGMAGHGGRYDGGDRDFVYWLDKKSGVWETDYTSFSLPSNGLQFNVFSVFKKKYPQGFRGLNPSSWQELKNNWSLYMATPAESEAEADFFIDVIKREIMAKRKDIDGYTDLAFVNLKATDAAGHSYGPDSVEMEEALAATDRQIGKIFRFLEQHYHDNFAFIVTADHGVAPPVEFTGGSKLSFQEIHDHLLSLTNGKESVIRFMTQTQMGLNRDVMKKYNISLEDVAGKLQGMEKNGDRFFRMVKRADDYRESRN